MPTIINRPSADPLDDIDRESSGVDSAMERQERADLPGERSDQPGNQNEPGDVFIEATRELSRQDLDLDQTPVDGDREAERIADGDADVVPLELARGADDDDPIDEIERAGDDSIR